MKSKETVTAWRSMTPNGFEIFMKNGERLSKLTNLESSSDLEELYLNDYSHKWATYIKEGWLPSVELLKKIIQQRTDARIKLLIDFFQIETLIKGHTKPIKAPFFSPFVSFSVGQTIQARYTGDIFVKMEIPKEVILPGIKKDNEGLSFGVLQKWMKYAFTDVSFDETVEKKLEQMGCKTGVTMPKFSQKESDKDFNEINFTQDLFKKWKESNEKQKKEHVNLAFRKFMENR